MRAQRSAGFDSLSLYFPSFSEGLSLRGGVSGAAAPAAAEFPFLFGGTFIEGHQLLDFSAHRRKFPFLFGGTFIEGRRGDTKGPTHP